MVSVPVLAVRIADASFTVTIPSRNPAFASVCALPQASISPLVVNDDAWRIENPGLSPATIRTKVLAVCKALDFPTPEEPSRKIEVGGNSRNPPLLTHAFLPTVEDNAKIPQSKWNDAGNLVPDVVSKYFFNHPDVNPDGSPVVSIIPKYPSASLGILPLESV